MNFGILCPMKFFGSSNTVKYDKGGKGKPLRMKGRMSLKNMCKVLGREGKGKEGKQSRSGPASVYTTPSIVSFFQGEKTKVLIE